MRALDLSPGVAVADILRQAIDDENDSYAYYMRAAELVHSPWERDMFRGLAEEELKHARRLEDLLANLETREALNTALGG